MNILRLLTLKCFIAFSVPCTISSWPEPKCRQMYARGLTSTHGVSANAVRPLSAKPKKIRDSERLAVGQIAEPFQGPAVTNFRPPNSNYSKRPPVIAPTRMPRLTLISQDATLLWILTEST